MGLDQDDGPHQPFAGDSFEDFVRSRSTHLFQLALLLVGQIQADAEDLVQVALERAWQRQALRPWDRNPEPCVRRILTNLSIDRWRQLRRRAEQQLEGAGVTSAAGDPAGAVATRDLLLRVLAKLPPRQRALLALRYWEERSEAEIADLLGCSIGTVKSRASRGLAGMRELAGVHEDARARCAEVHRNRE